MWVSRYLDALTYLRSKNIISFSVNLTNVYFDIHLGKVTKQLIYPLSKLVAFLNFYSR